MREPVDVRILCPGGNWMAIGSLLANGMGGYHGELPAGSTVAAVTGTPPAALAMDGPRLVAGGRFHFGITTPTWALAQALHGRRPYAEPLPVRAIAGFAHDDRLALAVRASTGLTSVAQIAERRLPLKISMPTADQGHPARWVLEEILAWHGFSQDDLEGWGGAVLRDRPRAQNTPDVVPADPSFDAVFDEAIMTWRWRRLTERYDLRFLPLEPELAAHLATLGVPSGVIGKGRLPGVDDDVPAVDFSGWVLYCSADLPDALAALAVRALDEQAAAISARFTGPTAAMTAPVDLGDLCRDLPVPLHPGAGAAYRELGHTIDEEAR